MRHGRAKQARRTLQFFERTGRFQKPYHIILDGTFIVAAVIKYKVPVKERLDKLLQHAPYHLHVCQSTISELQKLKEQQQNEESADMFGSALKWAAANCVIIRKDELKEPEQNTAKKLDSKKLSDAAVDIYKLIVSANHSSTSTGGNHNHATRSSYFCASQDADLLDCLRNNTVTPVLRLARGSVLLLENPSKHATATTAHDERTKWKKAVTESEQKLVEMVVKHDKQQQQQANHQRKAPSQQQSSSSSSSMQPQQQRKKPKAKGPNPLSCKKRANDSSLKEVPTTSKRKRLRRKKTSSSEAERSS